ncbi:MAG TPA: cellulase family glycosylhydrolase [Chloroflexota bacterium]|nr:cellulase family glycosylhydrolase [Chloroflexota bacterium]
MRRRFLALAAMLAVLLSIVPAAASTVAAAGADYDIAGGHFYTQANGDGSANGFAVTDDASAPMWTWFQKYGGVGQLGYPNTNRFQSPDGFIEQGFQKSLLQWHPDTQTMAFVNIFDLLHAQQGMDGILQATYQIPPPIDNSAQEKGINGADPNGFKQLEAIRDAWLQYPNPAFVNYYNADPYHVDHFGLPTSKPADFGPFITVRLQRTAFQLWKVDGPAGIKAGTLVQVNGSDIAKAVNFYSKAATTPSAPPAGAPAGPSAGPASATGLQYGFAAEMIGASATQVTAATKNAGFGWVKQQIRWDGLQPSPTSTPNWGPADAAVNTANAAGLKVMFSVVAAPAWAAVPGGHFPAHPSDAAAFFGAMAAHFKGRVQAYEVWNEENYAVEMGPGVGPNTAGAYVEALKAVYPAIKAADPNAIVVTGAPTPTGVNDPNIGERDITFLQQMYAYQNGVVKQYFDALGAHNEPFGNQPQETVQNHTAAGWSNDPSFFFRQVEDYHNLMVQNGDTKPIWETEVGYDSNPQAPDAYGYAKLITEQNQADWLVALFNYTKQNYPWMGTMFVWNLNYQAVVPQTDEKWGFGVLRADYSPRPAYTALAAMPKS